MEGLEAWEYQHGASIDVLYTMVGSNCRALGKNLITSRASPYPPTPNYDTFQNLKFV